MSFTHIFSSSFEKAFTFFFSLWPQWEHSGPRLPCFLFLFFFEVAVFQKAHPTSVLSQDNADRYQIAPTYPTVPLPPFSNSHFDPDGMSDVQAPQPHAPSTRGGRRNTPRGSGRGRRGRQSTAPAAEVVHQRSTPTTSTAAGIAPTSNNQPQESGGPSSRGARGHGRGRGRGRGRQGRGGGSANNSSVLIPRRTFGGHLTSTSDQAEEPSPGPTLSADAPEFVPGRSHTPRPAGPTRRRNPGPRPNQDAGQAEAVAGATTTTTTAVPKPKQTPAPKSSAADLPTRIHDDIDNGQYECVICTGEVLRNSRIWSCTICWTVTHLHCVKKWHTNQIKNQEQNPAPAPAPDPDQPPGWRCPGCNSALQGEPSAHHCWCGKEINAKSIVGLPPHSCGQTCSKPRATCPHPCTLMCHAGPCPPCTLMGPTQTCFCGKNTSTKRCSETDYGSGWSCQEVCGDLLPCGEHACSRLCHSGLCGGCETPVPSACYCGKVKKDIPCDRRGDIRDSFAYERQSESPDGAAAGESLWFEASFGCSTTCGRKFDCGHHSCEKGCHPQDERPAPCPWSPSLVSHCPCGKTALEEISSEPRHSCLEAIPHCDKACEKLLSCGHLCVDKCHTGPCSPCRQIADITCRCGRTTTTSICTQGSDAPPPQCFRVCRAQLNCGRHECGEHCCPGERKAAERRRQKRSANGEFEAEHICLQACGRLLKCGKHTCRQLCHRGPCASCLEAVFDEISCSCGRTVLQPPQPCGTRPPECRFDCTKPRPCGHPTVSHQCHPEDASCPKCPFLVEKLCICGKKELKNQPCWFGEARCGLPCEKKLKCGAHECKKTCHRPGQCEDADVTGSHCAQPCGKVRRSCDHTCIDQCHAPYACKEDKPCQSKTFVTCPCQRRKQEIRCQATRLNPWPSREPLKCDDECLQLQRNRRLAEALNIDPETHTDDHVPYSDTTLKLFRENINWAQTQEREFRVFASDSEEKRIRFKPMPSHQRAFLHALAEDFGLDSESQDPEPHRHVCIFKTPRFVSAPRKTLGQCLRIVRAAAGVSSTTAPASALGSTTNNPAQQAFNAFLLTAPRFGLTVDEVDDGLAAELANRSGSGPALKFETSFRPADDEIIIKAIPTVTAASVATSLAPTPHAVQDALARLKPAVAGTVARLGLAGSVSLCCADASAAVVRREGDTAAAGAGGWSTVASRGSWKRLADAAATGRGSSGIRSGTGEERRAPSSFVALRKTMEPKKKAVLRKEIEEDWFAAAEKLELEGGEAGTAEEAGAAKEDSGGREAGNSVGEDGAELIGLTGGAARAPELVPGI